MEPYIHLNRKEIIKPIYRVIPFERFIDILINNSIQLSKPALWDDPFENFLFKKDAESEHGPVKFNVVRNNMFGQCWTFNVNTDFMWRVYAPNKNGVKLKTSIKKLYEAIYKDIKTETDYLYVGKVNYTQWKQIKATFENIELNQFFSDTTYRSLASTLLIKRSAFKPENEVRVIVIRTLLNISGPDRIAFNIDPNLLFDNVVLDPRLTEYEFTTLKASLRKLGFKNKILKSSLYSEPDLNLRF